MTGDPLELERIQRWMQAVIMHPAGVVAGVDSPEARKQISISPGEIERVVPGTTQFASIDRLRVYGNAYFARLLECLREEFPALVHVLGQDAFDALALGYLRACPSQSYTLGQLGARFPAYLEETRPRDEDSEAGASWPDFLIDLARLERTYSDVFDGPGVEGRTLLQFDDILNIGAKSWGTTRLTPVECLMLLRLAYPVHEYATAVRKGEQPAIPDPHRTFLAVTRRDYVVRRWSLAPIEFAILEALVAGETVEDALEAALDQPDAAPVSVEERAGQVREWFRQWTIAGFFAGCHC